ncbi:MAG: hypothetical protein OXG71_04810, partial [Rhodospirillales bacterium]|nr:hypothetical protein [Rhodospirillales bacterium]
KKKESSPSGTVRAYKSSQQTCAGSVLLVSNTTSSFISKPPDVKFALPIQATVLPPPRKMKTLG